MGDFMAHPAYRVCCVNMYMEGAVFREVFSVKKLTRVGWLPIT